MLVVKQNGAFVEESAARRYVRIGPSASAHLAPICMFKRLWGSSKLCVLTNTAYCADVPEQLAATVGQVSRATAAHAADKWYSETYRGMVGNRASQLTTTHEDADFFIAPIALPSLAHSAALLP